MAHMSENKNKWILEIGKIITWGFHTHNIVHGRMMKSSEGLFWSKSVWKLSWGKQKDSHKWLPWLKLLFALQ